MAGGSDAVGEVLRRLSLNSVCVDAACPNKLECWGKRHVTFMILGRNCTRACSFCNVKGNIPDVVDTSESRSIAQAVSELTMGYIVITSVTRDDLADKGAGQFVATVGEIKADASETLVELLIPDMDADPGLLKRIAFSGAEVIGHNIEMPESLYPLVRPEASYARSIQTLTLLREYSPDIPVKSSIIIGLGETKEEIIRTIRDLKDAGVDILYIGQYLSPSRDHWPVKKYYTPEEFQMFEQEAGNIGFKVVRSAPLVRSSYKAHESYLAYKAKSV